MTQPLPPLMMLYRNQIIGYGETPGFDLPAAGHLVNLPDTVGFKPLRVRSLERFALGGRAWGDSDATPVYAPGNIMLFLVDSTHDPGPVPATPPARPRVDLWHAGTLLGRMVKTLEPDLEQVQNLEDERGRRRFRCTDIEWWLGDAGPSGDASALVYRVIGKRCHLTLIAND